MENKTLTLGSLFDGSGGFPLGGLMAGITPVWASEIEPFPIRVTTKRLPCMKHYGDISKLNGADLEPVDIITFGSPCTDMSVAGKRAGLDGNQSVLFYQAVRIIKEMRCATNGEYPGYIVWENVPGAFSSNNGEDFRAVLQSVAGIVGQKTAVPPPDGGRWPTAGELMGDGWSAAYRTLDAQYWGVPQRRRRIFLVADLTGGRAGQILFESESVSGYSAPCFCQRQGTAGDTENGAGASGICLSDQGGERMDVHDGVSGTLRARANHPPCVMQPGGLNDRKASTLFAAYGTKWNGNAGAFSGGNFVYDTPSAGFCTEHSSKSRSIGYEEELSPTLRAGVVPAAVYENHSQDTRYDGPLETAPTVAATYGTGGNNQPFVVSETPKTLKIRSGGGCGGKGALIQEDLSATLSCNNDQTLFEPKAYGICSDKSNSMLSDNPHSGVYEADTSRTIDTSGTSPSCNQGGVAIVEAMPFTQNQRNEVRTLGDKSGALCAEASSKQQTFILQGSLIGRGDSSGPNGGGVSEDVSFTLNTVDRHAVYSMTTGSFTQVNEELAPTIAARDYKDPSVVNQPQYTVRRFTPTECARLQGFPDWWCSNLGTKEPTAEELEFWRGVWETHRLIIGGSAKPKTDNQLRKWLADPHSDAAEYKMWGNGVALPCVYFVLSGIVWAAGQQK